MLNKLLSNFTSYWLPVIFTMGAIFYLSSIQGKDIPVLFSFQDIPGHMFVYAVLGFFVKRLLKHNHPTFSPVKLVLVTVLIGIAYGVSDEFHQLFVPGRFASLADIISDTAGSLVGGLVYR